MSDRATLLPNARPTDRAIISPAIITQGRPPPFDSADYAVESRQLVRNLRRVLKLIREIKRALHEKKKKKKNRKDDRSKGVELLDLKTICRVKSYKKLSIVI